MVKKGLKIEKEKEIIYNVFKITKEEVKYMMKENKKGITLLALVITIVIMLLLAGVALQMAIGENGLISKAAQAKSLQEKAELYDTAKLEYINMKSVTLENGQQHPIAEDVLLSPGFLRKYDVVGDNITDKKGKVIETKENLINAIKGNDTTQAGQLPQPTIPAPIPLPSSSFPKNIAGVTILEEQKNETIIKLRVKQSMVLRFTTYGGSNPNFKADTGNGTFRKVDDLSDASEYYTPGEYIIRMINKPQVLTLQNALASASMDVDYEIEVIQWGENAQGNIHVPNVVNIYDPEPDAQKVQYIRFGMEQIPEWLFMKKTTQKYSSRIQNAEKLKTIPEKLYENCVNMEVFDESLTGTIIKKIPKDLFKNCVKAKSFKGTFRLSSKLEEIPEELFNNNNQANDFEETFLNSIELKNIPNNLINKVAGLGANVTGMFRGATKASNYNTIPNNMK